MGVQQTPDVHPAGKNAKRVTFVGKFSTFQYRRNRRKAFGCCDATEEWKPLLFSS